MGVGHGYINESNRLIRIPHDRPWRSLDKPCPFLNLSNRCLRDKLVDVDRAVNEAVEAVAELINRSQRVPPIIISRVYRGGKTTLIDLISKKLSESRYHHGCIFLRVAY